MKRIKVVRPVTIGDMNEKVLEGMRKFKDADTELAIENLEKGPESIECTYDEAWAELFTVQECEKAEKEGYDGVIVYCFGDPGLRAAKESLNIPVVGINEPAIHMASMLGSKFSIITIESTFLGTLVDKLKLYGFESRCASIRFLGIPVLDLEKQRGEQTERLFEEAKKAVEEDGADTIVLGCGDILGVGEKVSRELKVPVVMPGIVALKMCETLIDMGLAQSKLYFKVPPNKRRIS